MRNYILWRVLELLYIARLKNYILLQEAKALLMPVDTMEAMAMEMVVGMAMAMTVVTALAIQLTDHLMQPGDLDIIQALRARFQSPLSAV